MRRQPSYSPLRNPPSRTASQQRHPRENEVPQRFLLSETLEANRSPITLFGHNKTQLTLSQRKEQDAARWDRPHYLSQTQIIPQQYNGYARPTVSSSVGSTAFVPSSSGYRPNIEGQRSQYIPSYLRTSQDPSYNSYYLKRESEEEERRQIETTERQKRYHIESQRRQQEYEEMIFRKRKLEMEHLLNLRQERKREAEEFLDQIYREERDEQSRNPLYSPPGQESIYNSSQISRKVEQRRSPPAEAENTTLIYEKQNGSLKPPGVKFKDLEGILDNGEFIANSARSVSDKGKVSIDSNIVSSFNTPAERIIKTLLSLQKKDFLEDEAIQKEIEFAITSINERNIYNAAHLEISSNPIIRAFQKKHAVLLQWVSEYSENDSSDLSIVNAKIQSISRRDSSNTNQSIDESSSGQKNDISKNIQSLRRKSTIHTLKKEYENQESLLNQSATRSFDIFQFTQLVGRENTLSLLSLHFITQHNVQELVDQRKLALFLDDVNKIYRRDVTYHNDLHGADVAHMANLILTQGGLINLAGLHSIDILSFLIAAACHDLGHDGYTNGYHINAFTDRAIKSNDISVQESYHVAETFAIIKRDETNFLEQLSRDEFRVFRKRVVGCILATDMAKHAADLSALKSIVQSKEISNGVNAYLILNKTDDVSLFKSQQFILEISLHACDVSQQTRDFDVCKTWTYLLFEEFFAQGDLEKDQGLPISFLCNRETTSIPKNQPGFLNGITLPIWSLIAEIMPGMKEMVETAKLNVKAWEEYSETEKDQEVYTVVD